MFINNYRLLGGFCVRSEVRNHSLSVSSSKHVDPSRNAVDRLAVPCIQIISLSVTSIGNILLHLLPADYRKFSIGTAGINNKQSNNPPH